MKEGLDEPGIARLTPSLRSRSLQGAVKRGRRPNKDRVHLNLLKTKEKTTMLSIVLASALGVVVGSIAGECFKLGKLLDIALGVGLITGVGLIVLAWT